MNLKVDVITPEKVAFSDEVDFVAAPASDGEIGILPGHTLLLTRLGTGVLRLKRGDNVTEMAISDGFLEVTEGHKVAIFSQTAEMAKDIDIERARLAADHAKEKLSSSRDLTAEELALVEAALSRAMLRMKVGAINRGHGAHSTLPGDN